MNVVTRVEPRLVDLQDLRVSIRMPARWSREMQEQAYDRLDEVDLYVVIHDAIKEAFKKHGAVLTNTIIEIEDL